MPPGTLTALPATASSNTFPPVSDAQQRVQNGDIARSVLRQQLHGAFPKRHVARLHGVRMDPKSGFWLDFPTDAARRKREAAWRAFERTGGMLVLVGAHGVGKTQLALELCQRLAVDAVFDLAGEAPFRYASWPSVVALEKASWRASDDGRPMRELAKPNVLVLDELQDALTSTWARAQLAMLIDERYGAMRRTILLTNLGYEAAVQAIPSSVVSRITETGAIVECDWPSFRTGGGA